MTFIYGFEPEEWIVFVDKVQKALVGRNTGPLTYKYMQLLLKGDAKAEFIDKANFVGNLTVGNFSIVMATMTVHIFPTFVYCDLKQYLR